MAPITKPNPTLVNKVLTKLRDEYDKKHVLYDGGRVIKVLGPPSRPERKKMLAHIATFFRGAKYHQPAGDSPGDVKYEGLSIVAKKMSGASGAEDGKERASLKPKDIKPTIVNSWLTPDAMVKNVLTYIKNSHFDVDFSAKVTKLLKDTENIRGFVVPYDDIGDPIPPEFFEVLTAIKLAVSLRQDDRRLRVVLGIPPKIDLRRAKIKIFIPLAANMPLLDYEINISANENKTDEPSIKISVKSKLAGKVVNTVKFSDAFETTTEVNSWYADLGAQKSNQKGPYNTALAAAKAQEQKKTTLFALLAVGQLLDTPQLQSVIRTRYMPKLPTGSKNISNLQYLRTALAHVKQKFSVLAPRMLLTEKTVGLTDIDIIRAFIKIALRTEQKIDPTFGNFAVACEKILVDASKRESETKYNFYQMFYDRVLCEKHIAYAVAEKQGKTVKYSFYSNVNYEKEYTDWVGLRIKNSANEYNKGTLGMDV